MLYPGVPSPTTTNTCSPKTEVLTSNPKICKVHYSQTIPAEWLLLTGYRQLPMPSRSLYSRPSSSLQTAMVPHTLPGSTVGHPSSSWVFKFFLWHSIGILQQRNRLCPRRKQFCFAETLKVNKKPHQYFSGSEFWELFGGFGGGLEMGGN